jgi:predicted metal-dependent phosphoesterase TrpH
MYDLHIHSNHSDGADTWQDILQKAEAAGLECISITDHDNCEVYFHMKDPQQFFSGKIIPGIELQAYFKGLSIEILGYDFDVHNMRDALKTLYLPFAEINRQELARLHAKSTALGMVFLPNVLENYDPGAYHYAMEYLHNEMKKSLQNRALIPDEESREYYYVFFKRHISNPNSPLYIDESDLIPDAYKVIGVIRQAGGKVVLPHVYQYEENPDAVLTGLLDSLDGIECFYPSFTTEQREYLEDLCNKNRLMITGGSDYHGEHRPGRIGMF